MPQVYLRKLFVKHARLAVLSDVIWELLRLGTTFTQYLPRCWAPQKLQYARSESDATAKFQGRAPNKGNRKQKRDTSQGTPLGMCGMVAGCRSPACPGRLLESVARQPVAAICSTGGVPAHRSLCRMAAVSHLSTH